MLLVDQGLLDRENAPCTPQNGLLAACKYTQTFGLQRVLKASMVKLNIWVQQCVYPVVVTHMFNLAGHVLANPVSTFVGHAQHTEKPCAQSCWCGIAARHCSCIVPDIHDVSDKGRCYVCCLNHMHLCASKHAVRYQLAQGK